LALHAAGARLPGRWSFDLTDFRPHHQDPSMTNTGATLAQALALHQQGRLQEAVSLYQRVLQSEPRNSDALHLLGLVMATVGQAQKAVSLLTAAVQIQPSNPAMQTNLGGALSAVGRHAEALPCYDRAIALQ